MAGNQFYSEEEAEEILRLAVGRTAGVGGVSRDNLRQSAAELGISDEQLAEAETLVMEQRLEQAERDEFRQYQRTKLKKDFWEYLSINAVFVGLNLWHAGRPTWSLLVLGFWTMGMILTAISCLVPSSSGYQEGFEKWKKRKRKRAEKALVPQNELLDRLILEHENLTKIEAIKLVRSETGMDLKDSKAVVDRYSEQNPHVLA